MKPRARRVTIAAAGLGAGVVALLVVLNWGTVRDHVQAWYFQLTRETKTIEPLSIDAKAFRIEERLFHVAANRSRCPVIFDPGEVLTRERYGGLEPSGGAKGLLEANGYRVLEQRFPRRAYVVIRDAHPEPRKSVVRWRSKRPLNPVGVYRAPQEATPAE